MYYKHGFTLLVDEDVDCDVVKFIFTVKDTATHQEYTWNRSPYSMPTLEEFSEYVSGLLETITE
jgi:hypothetical protein